MKNWSPEPLWQTFTQAGVDVRTMKPLPPPDDAALQREAQALAERFRQRERTMNRRRFGVPWRTGAAT
jgi:hypothetical protein